MRKTCVVIDLDENGEFVVYSDTGRGVWRPGFYKEGDEFCREDAYTIPNGWLDDPASSIRPVGRGSLLRSRSLEPSRSSEELATVTPLPLHETGVARHTKSNRAGMIQNTRNGQVHDEQERRYHSRRQSTVDEDGIMLRVLFHRPASTVCSRYAHETGDDALSGRSSQAPIAEPSWMVLRSEEPTAMSNAGA